MSDRYKKRVLAHGITNIVICAINIILTILLRGTNYIYFCMGVNIVVIIHGIMDVFILREELELFKLEKAIKKMPPLSEEDSEKMYKELIQKIEEYENNKDGNN